jgi:hypothetical protein
VAGTDEAAGEAELGGTASDVEDDEDVKGARSRTEEAAEPVAEDGLWPDDMVVVEAGEEGPGGVQLEGDPPRGDGLHGPSLWHAGGAP